MKCLTIALLSLSVMSPVYANLNCTIECPISDGTPDPSNPFQNDQERRQCVRACERANQLEYKNLNYGEQTLQLEELDEDLRSDQRRLDDVTGDAP